jgi:hypothetical protein
MRWWKSNWKDPKDLAAIQNCIFGAHACSYWHWHQGSHLFFWRFPNEFQTQMQDGIPFYHLCPAPRGHAHNTPSPSREAEIKYQKKMLQLRLRGFIEKGYIDLITQRFPVVKVMVEGDVLDIQVVWNSKSNGHNATLWAPGFMLDDIGDVKEMMVKWLAIPVAIYLNSGSPSQDYSQSAGTFTKSKQGDIDVGAMFNNFHSHPTERHALGVRIIETQPEGTYECHEIWHFCIILVNALPLILCVKDSV